MGYLFACAVFLPVGVGGRMQFAFVLIPGFQGIIEEFVVKQKRLAIDHLKRFRVHFHPASVVAHRIRAPAAILRLILWRIGLKQRGILWR